MGQKRVNQYNEKLADWEGKMRNFMGLMGNTGGDFSEAETLATTACSLSPDSGAYLDTLAHVYFHHGDYEKAVEQQAKAAELEPHSGLIAQQLKRFQAALAEEKEEEEEQQGDGDH